MVSPSVFVVSSSPVVAVVAAAGGVKPQVLKSNPTRIEVDNTREKRLLHLRRPRPTKAARVAFLVWSLEARCQLCCIETLRENVLATRIPNPFATKFVFYLNYTDSIVAVSSYQIILLG